MDDTRKIAQCLHSIDRTLKVIAEELKKSNGKLKNETVVAQQLRKALEPSSF